MTCINHHASNTLTSLYLLKLTLQSICFFLLFSLPCRSQAREVMALGKRLISHQGSLSYDVQWLCNSKRNWYLYALSNSSLSKIYKIQIKMGQVEHKKGVWLDCDPGLDDTFAIIYAAHAKQIDLYGISTSPGNTSLVNTTRNALDVLYNIGRKDVPVFSGSNTLIEGEMKLGEYIHGQNGLGGVQLPRSPHQATTQKTFQKIYQRICSYEGKLIWANTGSLTNLCILLQTYPSLQDKLSQIVMMGGAIGKGNITPAAEFNIFFDPKAFEEVLRLKGEIPLVMIPLEVTHQNLATQLVFEHFKRFEHIPFAKAIHNMLEQFQIMYLTHEGFPFPPIHDPCTIFYILHPEQFEASYAHILVDTYPVSYGRTNVTFSRSRTNNIVTTHLKNEKTKFWEEMGKIFENIFSEHVQGGIAVSE